MLTAEKHPQADKLQVLSVDAGDGPVQVVCGAPNARAGMLGVFGAPGTYVPGSDMTLKVAAIRGVESRGMMCSVRELELGEEHDGIIELAEDAPVGANFAAYAGLDDPVFDVAVTPEPARLLRGQRHRPRPRRRRARPILHKPNQLSGDRRQLRAGAESRSSRRTRAACCSGGGSIRGVRNGPSPDWLQQRLKAVGLRPISALVDITNFFSIDQARPLHVYDVKKLQRRHPGPARPRRRQVPRAQRQGV